MNGPYSPPATSRSVDLIYAESMMSFPRPGISSFFFVGDSAILTAVPGSYAQVHCRGRQEEVFPGKTFPCFSIPPRLLLGGETQRAVALSHESVSGDYGPYTPIATRSLRSPNLEEGIGEAS